MSIIKGKFLKVLPDNLSDFTKLSVSKVKTFKTCKAKYYYTYIVKVKKKEWEFQSFGSFLHEVLERFEHYIIQGRSDPDNIIMKDSFKEALTGTEFKGELGVKWSEKLTKDQRKECFDILLAFLERRSSLKKDGTLPKVIETEKPFNIVIDDVLLNGFIDLLQIDNDGVLHVADYKSSKDKKYFKKDYLQLKTYAYSLCLENPDLQKVRCSYIMLRHKFEHITFEFSREEIMTCEQEYLDYYKEIIQENLFRPTPSPLCVYCDALDLCEDGKKRVDEKNKKEEIRFNKGLENPTFGEKEW